MERTLTMEEIVASEAFASYPAEEQRICLLLLEGERSMARGNWMTSEEGFAKLYKLQAELEAEYERNQSGVKADAV
jgi:hypothetical protein